jgi:hypothetical protein
LYRRFGGLQGQFGQMWKIQGERWPIASCYTEYAHTHFMHKTKNNVSKKSKNLSRITNIIKLSWLQSHAKALMNEDLLEVEK